MEAKFYKNIDSYFEVAYPFLVKRELENGLFLTILSNLKNHANYYGQEPPILTAITENNEIKLISFRTPPYNQLLSFSLDLRTVDILIDALIELDAKLPGVLGPKTVAERFVKLWAEKQNLSFRVVMNERLYKLEKVSKETLGERKFRLGNKTDEELILQWGKEFMLEALPERDLEMVEESIKRLRNAIYDNRIFLLFDKEKPVSMARKAGKTPHGNAVNGVYTPPSLRRKGYATECVAKLSKHLLDEGNNYCFLFTDLSNPISNSIYQKIGYYPITDVDEYRFDSQSKK
ncbi:MAG: GNAT family N-acetyltransferase [Promethearchaeota archaeon]|jgi:predicted GNAT family acetyltransferase